ncbi:uncharacterized protein LOC135146601 isoform X2 [Zophobas morio]|uniref:uncharacterized protein LOC135146601 isoform X2 n=1 Tax=Zophobas morio TaxID=2755281 RepID=UPI003082DA76
MSITLVVRLQFKTFFRKFATSKQLYYFNMKQQEAKRRKLREEIKWGFFGDVKEYQKTKGKLFSAEKDLINSVLPYYKSSPFVSNCQSGLLL